MSDTHAVSNGSLHGSLKYRRSIGIDGRTRNARRFRSLFDAFAESLGGEAGLTEADRALARMAASLTLKSEALQADAAKGADVNAEDLVRVSNSLSRVLGRLGRKVAPRDAPQTLAQYLASQHEAAE